MSKQPFFCLDGPLSPLPASGQMRIANLAGFPDFARKLGADPWSLMERHEINPLLIRDPDYYIDCKSFVNLLEYCGSSLNNSLFGLQLARNQNADVFGSIATLCRSASTVREAVNSFIDYIPVYHSPSTLLNLLEGDEVAEIRWADCSYAGNNHQANYQAVLLNLKFLQLVSGGTLRPSYINLAVDARPKDFPELEKALNCSFNKTRSENAIGFPVGLLDQAVTSSCRSVFKLLGGYLDQVKKASRKSIVERVEDYVRGSLSSGYCSVERCADTFGMSVRSLQAHLSEQGLKFSDILEVQRFALAKQLLTGDQLSLNEIATQLGYVDQSSFGRAFKRWTGMAPGQYQKKYDGRHPVFM